MKMTLLLSSLFTSLWLNAFSQITVTNSTFPVAGDTLRFSVSQDGDGLGVGPGGPNQIWDFTALNADNDFETAYSPASTGANAAKFPGAELVTIGQGGAETYFNVTATRFESQGYSGPAPGGFNFPVTTLFAPALGDRRAPLTFGGFPNVEKSNFTITVSGALLPDTLLGGLSVDSVRVKVVFDRLDFVDGWGKMTIPGGTYDVLRERRFQTADTKIEVKLPFIGWFAPPFPIPGAGLDTTITYNFFSNTEKEPIAIVTTNNEDTEVQRVQFKRNKTTGLEPEFVFAANRPTVQAWPNPAVDYTIFRCSNVPDGDYTLKIYNVIGAVVWRQNLQVSGGAKSVRLDLDTFKKGTYLYSLSDSKGQILATKRLMIVKP